MADQTKANIFSDPLGTYLDYASKGVRGALQTGGEVISVAGDSIGRTASVFTVLAGTVWIVNIAVLLLLVWMVLKYGPRLLKAFPKVLPI